ncbi:MAG: hypothetical protein GY705_08340, partial [Bacteroidetes bacterium]|nr:hypothetical protein [Bacteroidota bacterium]
LKREKIKIIDSETEFIAASSHTEARELFRNGGLAFIIKLELECIGKCVMLSRARIIVKTKRYEFVMVGTLLDQDKTIKLEKEDYQTVRFVFDPSPYCANLSEVIRKFTGATCSVELCNIKM